MAKWIRSLIKPHKGEDIAYSDFEQQEFGIAAKLSNDDAMMESYASGDPYIQAAIRSGMAPSGATKATHGAIREKFKVVSLGINYGMSAVGLARRLAIPKLEADSLLEAHKWVFHKFWKWSDNTIEKSALYGKLYTPLGWRCSMNSEMKARSLRNWPVQSTGGDMLRLAVILCDERDVRVCATVHDAILITAPSGQIEAAVERALGAMVDASGVVLSGFKLRAEAQIIKWPNRYEDKDPSSKRIWSAAMKILEKGKGHRASGQDPVSN